MAASIFSSRNAPTPQRGREISSDGALVPVPPPSPPPPPGGAQRSPGLTRGGEDLGGRSSGKTVVGGAVSTCVRAQHGVSCRFLYLPLISIIKLTELRRGFSLHLWGFNLRWRGSALAEERRTSKRHQSHRQREDDLFRARKNGQTIPFDGPTRTPFALYFFPLPNLTR